MKLTVGSKIGLTSGVGLVALVALGVMAYQNIVVMKEDTRLVTHSYQMMTLVDRIEIDSLEAESAERAYLLEGKREYLTPYLEAYGRGNTGGSIADRVKEAAALAASEEEKAPLEQLSRFIEQRRDELGTLIEARQRSGLAGAQQRLASTDPRVRQGITDTIKAIRDLEEKRLEERLRDQEQSANRTMLTILLGVPGFVVLVGLVSLLLARDIAEPMKNMAATARQIARGDLSDRVDGETRTDEVGVLAGAFNTLIDSMKGTAGIAEQISNGNLRVEVMPQSEKDLLGRSLLQMVNNLREMLKDMQHASQVIGASASQMAASSVEMAAGSAQTSAAVVETSATVSEIRQTAEVASLEARQVAERARQAALAASEGREATEAAGAGMLRIRDQMEAISRSMLRLSEQSQAISEIISSVDDLTQQSNLLAVNAAIEAAKAGERGKGFAVVAQEVRSLADQSRQATAQVRSILNDVQKATSAAVLATEQGTRSVEDGLVQFSQAGSSIRVLDESVADAAQSADQIAMSSREQLVGMEQLVQAIESIKQASQQNVDSAHQLEDSARDLQNLGSSLQNQMGRYNA